MADEKSRHGHRWLGAGDGRSFRTTGACHTRADDVRAAENRSLPAMNYFARGLAVDVGLDC
jgi:hypothetical protein